MQIVNANDLPKGDAESPIFTGPEVTRQALAPDSQDYNANMINFGNGVRNKLHTHSSDQLLIVTSGIGTVATEQEEMKVTVGDIILIPTGERHWQGATRNSQFSHIALTRSGSELIQVEE